VNLPETVVVEHAPSWSVNTIGTVTPEHLAAVPTDESNLVVKVAQSLMNSFSVPHARPIQFSVHKTVPVAGGMGGGSADAAAALLAVANFWEMDLSLGQLEVIAARIGVDVPFALRGGAARGTGHGEVLTTIRQVSKLHWVLVPNDFGLSTPEVYAELDRLRSARGVDPRGVREAFMLDTLVNNLRIGASAEEIAPLLHNDLEEAAVSLRPELQKVLDLQEQVYALRAIVSGSGPTVAMLARNADDAIAIASRLRTYGQQAVVTSSPAGPARMVD
jgi:4-diphosphocytidyl-2-C-methyl-D-erythritol kinase